MHEVLLFLFHFTHSLSVMNPALESGNVYPLQPSWYSALFMAPAKSDIYDRLFFLCIWLGTSISGVVFKYLRAGLENETRNGIWLHLCSKSIFSKDSLRWSHVCTIWWTFPVESFRCFSITRLRNPYRQTYPCFVWKVSMSGLKTVTIVCDLLNFSTHNFFPSEDP